LKHTQRAWFGKRALDEGDLEKVAAYSRFGFDVNKQSEQHGMTALCLAARDGRLEALRRLLKVGANVNGRSREGDTPLLLTIKYGKTPLALELLAASADVSMRDAEGETPLMWCSLTGNTTVMEQALKRGAGVDAQDNDGSSALMLVVSRDTPELPDTLLFAIPSDGTQAAFERSPARRKVSEIFDGWNDEQKECTRLLRQFGASTKLKNKRGHDASTCYVRMSRPEWCRLLRGLPDEAREDQRR
jgi:hypothetical protein